MVLQYDDYWTPESLVPTVVYLAFTNLFAFPLIIP